MSDTVAHTDEPVEGATDETLTETPASMPEHYPTADEQASELEDPANDPEAVRVQLAGGYVGVVLSQHVDDNAPNLAEIVTTRLLVSHDDEQMRPRMVSALISEFGMLQEDAEALADTVLELPPSVNPQAEEPTEENTAPAPYTPPPVEEPAPHIEGEVHTPEGTTQPVEGEFTGHIEGQVEEKPPEGPGMVA